MFGGSRGVTMSFAGWLWADLLLGLFVIFAVASTVGQARPVRVTPAPVAASAPPSAGGVTVPVTVDVPRGADAQRAPGVDANALELTLPVNGAVLLSSDARAIAAEQARIATEVRRVVGQRRVALVLAYGSHADARLGDRLAEVATATLRDGPFDGSAVKPFHNLVAGDRGSTLQLSIYLYQDR